MHASRLESLDLRSKVAMGAVIATSLCYLATSGLTVFASSGVLETANEVFVGILGLALLGSAAGLICCLLTAMVAWSMWAYRAYANLPEVFGIPIENTPGWAPGSFFIPFINLFKPLQIMKEVWDKTAPERESGQHGWLNLWWACWIGQGFLSRVTGEESIELMGYAVYALLNVIEAGVYVGAACGAVQVVRRITKFQLEYAGGDSAHVADFFR